MEEGLHVHQALKELQGSHLYLYSKNGKGIRTKAEQLESDKVGRLRFPFLLVEKDMESLCCPLVTQHLASERFVYIMFISKMCRHSKLTRVTVDSQ